MATGSRPRIKRHKRSNAAAPGQHLGFSTQETVLAHRLLDSPRGSVLSLEVIDDVAVNLPDGETTTIQSKSALATNPISDHAIGLWKTLANWLATATAGLIDLEKTTFILYISKPTNGPIAAAFSEASSGAAALKAIAGATATLWGQAPNYPVRKTLADELAKYVNPVLEDSRLPTLVERFHLQFGSGSPIADFERELEKQFLAEGVLAELSTHILGWVKKHVAVQLEQQRPAVVARDEFAAEMNAYLRKIRVQNILRSYAKAPTTEEQQAELSRIFVRQLSLINLEDDDLLAAVSDFLVAAADRAAWAKEGLIHESSFDDFDKALQAAWRNNRIAARANHPLSPVSHGQSLFSDCMNYQTHLQGVVTPSNFVRGCYHALADALAIGWHPNYKILLSKPSGKQ